MYQSDIVAILNTSGTAVVRYTYDAWGKLLTTTGSMTSTLGVHNPLRYRGYVYDNETQLYYLQSRYYNPEIGRFVNADNYISTGQGTVRYNMFAYCNNCPTLYVDSNGTFPWIAIAVIAVAVVGLDHLLASNQPDGGYAVENEKRENGVVRRIGYASGNGFEVDANGLTVCDTEVGLASFTYENDYASIEFMDAMTASATAEVDWSGTPTLDINAIASIFSPSAEFRIPMGFLYLIVEAEVYLGGAGAGVELDPETGKFVITPPFAGVGGTYGVDIDYRN